MNLFALIQRLVGKKQPDDDMPYSIVLLLQSPFVMSEELLKGAASKAYGIPYDGSNEMYFVSFNPILKTVKAGSLLINLLEIENPYLGDPAEVAKGFNNKRLEDAWKKHSTWIAFDLINRDISRAQAYRGLAVLVAELLDTRSVGIYLPKENQFTIESDGSAAEHLRRLAK
jgi:hypothetical protein